MKASIILDCCSYEVKTGTKSYEYMDCFKTKKNKFFRKKLKDGRDIKKEILLLTVCPNCRHYVLKYLWYAKVNGRFQDWDESKIIRGKKADEIFTRRFEDYILIDLPNPFKPQKLMKQAVKIPWVYGKTIDNGMAQIPRYLDETADAGLKISCNTKTVKL